MKDFKQPEGRLSRCDVLLSGAFQPVASRTVPLRDWSGNMEALK